MKRIVIAIILVSTLTGCANLKFAWSASYATDNLAADIERGKAAK